MNIYQTPAGFPFAAAIALIPTLASAQSYTAYDLGAGHAYGIDGNNVAGFAHDGTSGLEWTGTTPASKVVLTPGSFAYGVFGNTLVGVLYGGSTGVAVAWNSPATNPAPVLLSETSSSANAISGSLIVGDIGFHATTWSSQSPLAAVDIHPNGYYASSAHATDGTWIAGGGTVAQYSPGNALAWTGMSAQDAVNLNPPGWVSSTATGVSGNVFVGYGNETGPVYPSHALMWNGANASNYSLLNSTGYVSTAATAISGDFIVGSGVTSDHHTEALLWTGPDYSHLVNLNQFLPSYYDSFEATGVDDAGDICGFAHNNDIGVYVAIVWKLNPAPEPSMLILPALGILGLLKRKLRR